MSSLNPAGSPSGSTLPVLIEAVKRFWADLKKTDIIVVIGLGVALASTTVAIILSIVFAARAQKHHTFQVDNPNLLNVESIDFRGIGSTTLQTSYPYWVFLLLNGVASASIIVSLTRAIFWNVSTPQTVWLAMFGTALVAGVVLVSMIALFLTTHKKLQSTQKRVREFNAYVCSKLLKRPKFLVSLARPPTDVVTAYETLRAAFVELANDSKTTDQQWAQALYTASIYQHMQTIGSTHELAKEAFGILQPTRMLAGKCKPADYMLYDGIFIEDYSSVLQLHVPAKVRNSPTFGAVMASVSDWITATNNLGNSIEPNQALGPFLSLTRWTAFVQNVAIVLVVIALVYLPRVRDVLLRKVQVSSE